MVNYCPQILLEYIRDGLVEQEHSGFVLKLSLDRELLKVGDDKDYPFYLRSCAKPLQAALLIDYSLDDFLQMTSEEIAICSASHAGEACHCKTVKSILDKSGVSESDMKCGLHKPLSISEKKRMLLNGEQENILQNNCSGKHAMMLALCKKNGWDLSNYDEINHPLQVKIKEKIYSLCELNADYPVTKDGCGVPIYSMPLKNMLKGYLNLFTDEKYSKIKNAFIENPYLIGGEDRLDTAIMRANKNLIAKVGAGGLCIVVNVEKESAILIKILDCDMNARAICIIDALKQLGWLSDDIHNTPELLPFYKKEIKTLHNETVGEVKVLFKIN